MSHFSGVLRGRSARRLGLAVLTLAVVPEVAVAKGPDPAERGLDLFVHMASAAIAGDVLPLDVLAYGFRTVTQTQPLPNASVTAAWDPETLGKVSAAPADVTATTDALGQARIEVPVPAGEDRKIGLLVAIRHGEHVRTRKFEIARTAPVFVVLQVPDSHVVPGSQVPTWLTVTDARTGGGIGRAEVDVALLEGGVERATSHVTTDASGLARASFFVPPNVTGTPPLAIRARLSSSRPDSPIESTVNLALREESPAMPRLTVRWKERQLKPGEAGHADVQLIDATEEPIAGHPIVYWTGPRGTTAPASDDEWKKSGTAARTDGLGRFPIETLAPRVVTAAGSDVTVVVRTDIEGQKLEEKRSLPVGQPVATASVEMESGGIVPGLAQRAYLYVSDGEHGVPGEFSVEGDGLRAKVTTDAHGYAELTWTVPEDIGAKRESGPCAGDVAAAIVVRQARPIAALARHPEPFELCATVERERSAILRSSMQIAHIGDKLKVAPVVARKGAKGPGSLVMIAPGGHGQTIWTSAAASPEAEIDLGRASPGVHALTLAVPQAGKNAAPSVTRVLVVPKVLPKLTAKLAGGRLAPGGQAEVDVVLDDGHGAPLQGSVTAVLIDKEGGGTVAGLDRLDTRTSLCDDAGAPRERCDLFLEGDASADVFRRSVLTTGTVKPTLPIADPVAHTTAALEKTFSDVLHSLEGAVFQSQTPESLRDVRRQENGRWVFNPELMTLVTASMSEAPTTPGGEPFGLADLLAVDPQVTFDAVARRVTRLKLFRVLSALRSYKQSEQLDDAEPMLGDPGALLRRLVRAGTVTQEDLLDPWGGSIQFVHTNGPAVPFLTIARGWALQSPGPDRRIGTGDDVKDPFERVVRSPSPYATAMGEDEIVDARWNMKVGDATVAGWQEMFDRLTGTSLGHGAGTGSGQGFGSGSGRLGGSSTSKSPSLRLGRAITTDTARWTEPVRTDAQGRAHLRIPLGDYETTWRIALLARTDSALGAVANVDVSAFLPVSARVDIGRKLTAGDEVGARIVVRNRTGAAKSASLDLSTEGGLALARGQARSLAIDVPANAVRSAFVRVVATSPGQGKLGVGLKAVSTEGDRTIHEVTIEPPGEPRVLGQVWTGGASGATSNVLRLALPPGYTLRGSARLVLESGIEDALLGALAAVEPDSRMPPESLADTIEVAARIEKLAEAQGKRWLVARTRRTALFARAYLAQPAAAGAAEAKKALAEDRARLFAPGEPAPPAGKRPSPKPKPKPKPSDKDASEPGCPREGDPSLPVASLLEAEPPPGESGPLPCYTTLVGTIGSKSPLDLARTTLALFDRPHRLAVATTQAQELARMTRATRAEGPVLDGPRGDRAIVLAALARSAHVWSKDARVKARLIDTMLALRDAGGGYGSSEGTRDVVRALVGLEPAKTTPAKVTVEDGETRRTASVAPGGTTVVELGPRTTRVELEIAGGPVRARLERPVLRSFAAPPDTTIAPVAVAADWPNDAKAGSTGVLHLEYKLTLGRNVEVATRLPLPPGVELAAPVKNVVLRQGVLYIQTTLVSAETLSIPLRFTLPGKVMVPEAETLTVSEEQPRALTPARTLVVRP